MRPRLVILVLSFLLGAVPASAQELAASGADVVYTGAYSDDWVAAGDLGRLSQIGNPLTFGGTFHHPGEGHQNTYWILEQVWQAGATPVANLEIFATSYEIAAGFHITQIGSSPQGGEKDEWISDMFDFLAADPNMIGFVYFNFDKGGRWASVGWIRGVGRLGGSSAAAHRVA